jgi:serine/threonine protein kinase
MECPTLEAILAQMESAESLGKGQQGEVFKLGDFVLKTVTFRSPQQLNRFDAEAAVLRTLATNPKLKDFLPALCWAQRTSEKGYILQRYEPVVPLDKFLRDLKTEGKKWNVGIGGPYVLALLKAFAEIHRIGILHRDIKPGNLLVRLGTADQQKKPMIIDFGLTCQSRYCQDFEVGSVGYFAPNFYPSKALSKPFTKTLAIPRSVRTSRPSGEEVVEHVVEQRHMRTLNEFPGIFSSKHTDNYALAQTIEEIFDHIDWPEKAKAMKETLISERVYQPRMGVLANLAARHSTRRASQIRAAAENLNRKITYKQAAKEAAYAARIKQFERLVRRTLGPQATRKRRASL